MDSESSSALVLCDSVRLIRAERKGQNVRHGRTRAPAIEQLEERALLSAAPGGTNVEAAALRQWWAVSGSSQLTLKLAQDSARQTRVAARPATQRGPYAAANDVLRTPKKRPGVVAASAATAAPAAAALTAALAAAPTGPTLTEPTPVNGLLPVMPAMPDSDAWYSAIVNANEYIPNYGSNVPPDLGLITDLSGSSQLAWAESLVKAQVTRPQTLIGTYHSFRDAQFAATMTHSPPRAVPREGLSDSQILMTAPGNPDAHIVDYRQPEARAYLVRHVVEDVVKTGRALAFLDNVSHEETGFPVDWATTTSVLAEMTGKLHAVGKRVIANAAWVPGVTSTQSVEQFIATGADGVSLEMAFHQNVRNDIGRIETAMLQYRHMLDAGLTVIFIPVGSATGDPATVENTEIEQRLQAAFGMMFREPGDRLFVNQFFWRPVQEWTDWTERFGPALGPATLATNAAGEIVMTRQFANCTLTLNTATKEVAYQ